MVTVLLVASRTVFNMYRWRTKSFENTLSKFLRFHHTLHAVPAQNVDLAGALTDCPPFRADQLPGAAGSPFSWVGVRSCLGRASAPVRIMAAG